MSEKKPFKTKFKKMLLINSVAIFTGASITTPLIFVNKSKNLSYTDYLNLVKHDDNQLTNNNSAKNNKKFVVGSKTFDTQAEAKNFILSKVEPNVLYKYNNKNFNSKKELWDNLIENKINQINLNDSDVSQESAENLNFKKTESATKTGIEKKQMWLFNNNLFSTLEEAQQARKKHQLDHETKIPFAFKISNIQGSDPIFLESEKLIDYSEETKSFIPEVADAQKQISFETETGVSTYVKKQEYKPGKSEVSILNSEFNLINFDAAGKEQLERSLEIKKQSASDLKDTESFNKMNFRFLLDTVTLQSSEKHTLSSIKKNNLFSIKKEELTKNQVIYNNTIEFKFSNYNGKNLKSEILIKIRKNSGAISLKNFLKENKAMFSLKGKYILFNFNNVRENHKVHLEKTTYSASANTKPKTEVLNDLPGISLKGQNWKLAWHERYNAEISNYHKLEMLTNYIKNGKIKKMFKQVKNIKNPELVQEIINNIGDKKELFEGSFIATPKTYIKIKLSKNPKTYSKEPLEKIKFSTWYHNKPQDELVFLFPKELFNQLKPKVQLKPKSMQYLYKIKNKNFLYDSDKKDATTLETKLAKTFFEKEGFLSKKVQFKSNSENSSIDEKQSENINIKTISAFQQKQAGQTEAAKDKFTLKHNKEILYEISINKKADGSDADNPYKNSKIQILISKEQLKNIKKLQQKLKIKTIDVDKSQIKEQEAVQEYNPLMLFSAKKYWFLDSQPDNLFLRKVHLVAWYKKNFEYSTYKNYSFNKENYRTMEQVFKNNIKVKQDVSSPNTSISAQQNYK